MVPNWSTYHTSKSIAMSKSSKVTKMFGMKTPRLLTPRPKNQNLGKPRNLSLKNIPRNQRTFKGF